MNRLVIHVTVAGVITVQNTSNPYVMCKKTLMTLAGNTLRMAMNIYVRIV
jgi:hypothetical protein